MAIGDTTLHMPAVLSNPPPSVRNDTSITGALSHIFTKNHEHHQTLSRFSPPNPPLRHHAPPLSPPPPIHELLPSRPRRRLLLPPTLLTSPIPPHKRPPQKPPSAACLTLTHPSPRPRRPPPESARGIRVAPSRPRRASACHRLPIHNDPRCVRPASAHGARQLLHERLRQLRVGRLPGRPGRVGGEEEGGRYEGREGEDGGCERCGWEYG